MTFIHAMMRRVLSLRVTASVLLFVAAIAAAIIANSSYAPIYQEFLSNELQLRIGSFNLLSHGGHNMTMLEFINDGLMAIFFFSVGLEIKRELLVGELSSFRKALLPIIAAFGGMVIPVMVYLLVCEPGSIEGQGLAIPMATDIAFSLGVLSLLGSRVPLSLKVFLVAFAVVDDIGGILVIAIYYSSHVSYGYLLVAALLYLILFFIGRYGATNKIFFFVFGGVIWYLFLQSGIHSTISGVILAFVTPARPRLDVAKYVEYIRETIAGFPVIKAAKKGHTVLTNEQIATLKMVESASDRVISPLQSLEDNLHGMVNFLILPLFAFVNAGVVFSGEGELVGNVSIAVALGLLLGKFVGIYSFTWITVKSGIVSLPQEMNWKSVAGVSLLGGVGFTVSLFVANLSFGSAYPELLNQAKLGVLSGTVLSGILGYIVLRMALRNRKTI